jgi:hypothetical protein
MQDFAFTDEARSALVGGMQDKLGDGMGTFRSGSILLELVISMQYP